MNIEGYIIFRVIFKIHSTCVFDLLKHGREHNGMTKITEWTFPNQGLSFAISFVTCEINTVDTRYAIHTSMRICKHKGIIATSAMSHFFICYKWHKQFSFTKRNNAFVKSINNNKFYSYYETKSFLCYIIKQYELQYRSKYFCF